MPQRTLPFGLGSYTQCRQANTSAQVAFRLVYEMCMGEESIPGSGKDIWWRYQDVGR